MIVEGFQLSFKALIKTRLRLSAILALAMMTSQATWSRQIQADEQPVGKLQTSPQQTVNPKETSSLETASLDSAAIEALVQQLGAPSYSMRREAYQKLLKLGPSAQSAVDHAAESPDKQISESAGRLKTLIRVMTKCQDPQLALEVADLFLTANEENLGKLTERGLWDLAGLFLDEHESIAVKCQTVFFQDFGTCELIQQIVEHASAQGDVKLAWPIVSRLAPAELVYWTAGKLELPVNREPEDEDDKAKQLFFAGKPDEALKLDASPAVKYYIAMRGFQWEALKDKQIQRYLIAGQENPGGQAAQAMLLEFAGDADASQALWRGVLGLSDEEIQNSSKFNEVALKLLKEASPIATETEADARRATPTKPTAFHQLAVALILSGQADAVEQYLVEEDPQAAFGFVLRRDYSAALKLIGLEPDLSNFDKWLDREQFPKAKGGIKVFERSPDPEIHQLQFAMNLGQVGSILVGVGHRDEAKRILSNLVNLARDYPGESDVWNRCILRWVNSDKWRDLCIEVIGERFEQVRKEQRELVLEKLYPNLGSIAFELLNEAPVLKESGNNKAWDKAFRQLAHLERCDRDYFGSGAQSLVRAWLHRVALKVSKPDPTLGRDEPSFDDTNTMLALSKIANDWDDTGAALQFLGIQSDQPVYDFDIYLQAARICLKTKEPTAAIDCIEAISPGPGEFHLRSQIRMEALLSSGKLEQAEQEFLARWMRMVSLSWNGDRSNGYRVVDDFVKEEKWEEAAEYAERNFVMDNAMDRAMHYYAFWQMRQYATVLEELEHHQRSADVLRTILVDMLRPTSTIVRYFSATNDLDLIRFTAARQRISQAIALIQREDFTAARRELDIAFRLHSQDVEAVVSCYPLLAKAGKTDFANELLNQFEASLKAQLEKWPNDAMTLNNLAWMYAKSDVKLDQALQLSNKAIELVPSSAVYRDTLAEVQFHSGDIEGAINTMRECVRIDPRELGYRKNLARFSAARK